MAPHQTTPTIDDLRRAHQRIEPHIRHTPTLTSTRLDQLSGARLFFKCENFQTTGSFKYRGALNAVLSLSEETAVATHSSGNHGAALARAASVRRLTAHVVVPEHAVETKIAAIEAYGGLLHRCQATQHAREATLAELQAKTGAHPIPPYNDARIVAGQGTCALELLQAHQPLDILLAPIGGGGLASGTSIAAEPAGVAVVGVEPSGADDLKRSLDAGRIVEDFDPDTIADGLRAKVGPLTFSILADKLNDLILVDDAEIITAMRLLWHTLKVVVEPSSATVLAAVLQQKKRFHGRRVGLILSGGNVDLDHLPW